MNIIPAYHRNPKAATPTPATREEQLARALARANGRAREAARMARKVATPIRTWPSPGGGE